MNKKITKFSLLLPGILILLLSCNRPSQGGQTRLPVVDAVQLDDIDPALFSVDEWYVPYYLKHFARVANSVSESDTSKGFFDLSVWRGTRNHHTYNARVMEGILSLVWFYTKDRPWNPYYKDKAVKARIETALSFWCDIQHTDGSYSEYRVAQWSLAPTAFATKFIGQALWLLDQGPSIDQKIFERSRQSLRKAIYGGLTIEKFWDHGINYTNQYANLWGGAQAYLAVWPDEEIEGLFRERMQQSMDAFQSPAGFFYEKGGPDWGYNLNTHHSDLQMAWHYALDQEIRDMIIEKTERWYDWFAYNAVKEPGSSCYYLNRAVETRQRKGFFIKEEVEDPKDARWNPQAEFIPAVHAFELSIEEYRKSQKQKYKSVQQQYPGTASLQPGVFDTYTPYAFLHDGMGVWLPTAAQKKDAIAKLPYHASEAFIHVRKDDRSETSYTFIRKPSYYASFNSGKIITNQQRFGLGLIWNPAMGTVFQSQSRSDEAAWGTRADGTPQVYEAADLFAQLSLNQQVFESEIGKNDLLKGDLHISYRLGDGGQKSLQFSGQSILVNVVHSGGFTEILPFLVSPGDELKWDKNQILLRNAEGIMTIQLKGCKGIESSEVDEELHDKSCTSLHLKGQGKLSYEIRFGEVD